MKSLERLILKHLRSVVKPSLDPLQFAYQPRVGVEDAIIFLLHRAYTHLEEAGSAVRVFDFSSTFNTMQPALLSDKLLDMRVETPLVTWITNYLTGRPQYVRLQNITSDTVLSSTGAPQGTVLSPFLFTLYTSDFRHCTQSCHLQKFSDDSAIVGCISRGQEAEYRGEWTALWSGVDETTSSSMSQRQMSWWWMKEGSESTVFPQETQILQCLQNHAADVL